MTAGLLISRSNKYNFNEYKNLITFTSPPDEEAETFALNPIYYLMVKIP
jgi:hypothetical protein